MKLIWNKFFKKKKKFFSAQNRRNEHHFRISHIQISIGNNF